MKIRIGFVSNSSSSSFVVSKKHLSLDQINKIKKHIEYAKENFPQIIFAEGETDALTLIDAGYENVVAVTVGASKNVYKHE